MKHLEYAVPIKKFNLQQMSSFIKRQSADLQWMQTSN